MGIFTYYNIYFQLKYFKGDIFTNVIIAGVSEMAANVVTGLIFDRLGIKKSYIVSYLFGVSCSAMYITFGH